jgi:hypothetical protein
MAWPMLAAEILGEIFHLHPRLESGRVHLFNFGSKDRVYPEVTAELKIPFQVTGILVKILSWAELGRVNKDAHYYLLGPPQGLFHESQMSLVKVTHGGHKADNLTFSVAFLSPSRHLIVCTEYFHKR